MTQAREKVKAALGRIGLLQPARTALHRINAARKQRYYASMVEQYRSRFAKPMESYAGYERREREASVKRAAERYQADRKAILEAWPGASLAQAAQAVPPDRRRVFAQALLDRVLQGGLAPRFFDYDYIDDIVGIVGGRYCSDAGCDAEASAAILEALCIVAADPAPVPPERLPAALRKLLGDDPRYVPPRGDVTQHVHKVIPELAEEFIALKAETNVERFLEINREYSRRQAHGLGVWDIRDLSLLRGYERDHHLLLRTLVGLIDEGRLSGDDEALLIGPRHIDEVVFFRKTLGLRKAVGLDLFPYGRDEIVAGDMHRMPFEPDRFRLVYCAGTLSYSYNVRRVVDEIARVAMRPAYVFLVDAGGRHGGPTALGRSDIPSVDAMVGLFHRHRFEVLARDAGRSLAPELYENEPCLALRLET
jgi:hypothetical protein